MRSKQKADFEGLVGRIQATSDALQQDALVVINRSVTTRAWLTGYYIVEYEQHGADRAIDSANGFPLVVHLDALFDAGLISFDSHGKMMLSPKLSQEVIALLGLSGEVCLRNLLSDRQEKYLRYHRENVFQSTSVRGMTRTMQKIPSISAPSRFVV